MPEGEPVAAEPSPSTVREVLETPLAVPTEEYVAPAIPISPEIECYDSDTTFDSPSEAWPGEYDGCEGEVYGDEADSKQEKAVAIAYGDEGDIYDLGVLYSICAQNGPDSFQYLEQAGSPEQIAEVRGAMLLCPDHPQIDRIDKLLGGAEKDNKLEADGRIFGSGTFKVGDDIKAGTYFTTDVEGCYWERTDRNGNIIDNYFSAGAARVQVTIRSSDYSFNSDSCGEWRPVS